MACTVTATLSSDGCGFKVDGSIAYSIGNQSVDVTIDDDCSGSCGSISATINDSTTPVDVCDGDMITVEIISDCGCGGSSSEATCNVASLFVVSRAIGGKIKLSLTSNKKFKRIKQQRMAINKLRNIEKSLGKQVKFSLNTQKLNAQKSKQASEFWMNNIQEEIKEDYNFSILVHSNSTPNNLTNHYLFPVEGQENSIFLTEIKNINTPYVGIAPAEWDKKWPYILGLNQLKHIENQLHPKVVFTPSVADEKWAKHIDEINPGIKQYLEELSDFTGLKLEANRTLWSNTFICHTNVLDDLVVFWKKCFEYFDKKYGINYDYKISHQSIISNFYEVFVMLYFANRYDLIINQIDYKSSYL